MNYDYAIIGGGIVGLSVGMEICQRFPNKKVLILEKEGALSEHQTGHNSGVIHSGIYYKPGSLKAELSRKGSQQMEEFCRKHGIPYEINGKVIVAVEEKELPLLENLYQRGIENGLNVKKITTAKLKEIEPYVQGIGAIQVPTTGVVNYRTVAEKFGEIINMHGGDIRLNTKVEAINSNTDSVQITTNNGIYYASHLINCAGLMSDRVAAMAGTKSKMKIIPFRGEYYELKPEKRHLVNNLIYPVPNPDFPFLGVHFTKMIDGRVLIGPNAVLSFKREGYGKLSFNLKDFIGTVTYPGLWKMAAGNLSEGIKEMYRSVNKKALVREVQKFFPSIEEKDIIPAKSGVRAQAMNIKGEMIDDFVIIPDRRIIHVCNAPSPAATASIEIGKRIVDHLK